MVVYIYVVRHVCIVCSWYLLDIILYWYRLGIGPEGRRIPIANPRGIFPRMYKCLIVNQDGSTYHIRHHFPHKIITLPLDPSTLSEEEREVSQYVCVVTY